MKKSLICLLLIGVLPLCSCNNEPYIKNKIALELKPYEIPQAQPQLVTLYYPSEDNTKVLAFSKQLSSSGSLYTAIMDALLYGTEDGYISPFPKGVSLRSIMLVQDILYIDLSWQFAKMDVDRFFACVSVLATTFTALNEISFINITVEGAQLTPPGLPDHPIMLLSKYTGNISQLIHEYNALLNNTLLQKTFYGTIYVADNTNSYILPQTVSLNVRDKHYASALLSALITKSNDIFIDGFMVKSTPKFNKDTLYIDLTCPNNWNYNEKWLGKSAIVCTLNSLYPNVKNIQLTINDPQGNSIVNLKEPCYDVYNSIRSVVDVITPKSNGEGLMHTEMLITNMPSSSGIEDFLNEYILNITPEFRGGAKIVNKVVVSNNTVLIDLSQSYFDYFYNKSLSQQNEFAIVYSLIATACTFSGTTKALILQDGQKRSTLCGHIKLDTPLLTLPKDFVASLN